MVGLLIGEVAVVCAAPTEDGTGLVCWRGLDDCWLLGNWARICVGVPTKVFGEGSLAEATFTAAALVPEMYEG